MIKVRDIIKSVPFFNHLTAGELDFLEKNGSMLSIQAGKSVDLKKIRAMSVVLSGMFEIEAPGNVDIVYLSRGSFFGVIPFCDYRRKGNIRALVDSRVMLIQEEVLFKLFLSSYKSLRGYMRILNKTGFEITSTGLEYLNTKTTVISCVSEKNGVGKTMTSALLGTAFSKDKKTILLDMSYDGKSILEYLGKETTPPISEKTDESGAEKLIFERIVEVSENLHVLNVANMSRLKVNPEIFNIILFLLSKKYSLMIVDICCEDSELQSHVLDKSDYVLNFLTGKVAAEGGEFFLDHHLSEGQRIIHVRNDYYNRDTAVFAGGYTLEIDKEYEKEGSFENLLSFSRVQFCKDMKEFILSSKRSLVLESSQLNSAAFTGLLYELVQSGVNVDWYYSSSYSYILILLMLLNDADRLKDAYRNFFSTDFVRKTVNISFPDEYLFGISKFEKFARSSAGDRRVEMFRSLAMCKLSDGTNEKIFSSGNVSDLMSASFSVRPFFQEVNIGEKSYSSGFPESYVVPLECCRTVSDEIVSIELGNNRDFEIDDKKYPRIFKNIMTKNSLLYRKGDNLYSDNKFILEVSEKEFKFDSIFASSRKSAEAILKKLTHLEN